MMVLLQAVVTLCIIAILLARIWSISHPRLSSRLPPGPRGDPIIGHVRMVPASQPWVTYMDWARKYKSDIIYLNFLGAPAIVLSSLKAAVDLLEKRGAKYSGRPPFHFLEEQGWVDSIALISDGPKFKKHRRLLQNAFSPANCLPYRSVQQKQARRMTLRLIQSPENWLSHLVQFSTSIILGIDYGADIVDENDLYVQLSKGASYALSNGGPPGATGVDIFPIVRYLPRWVSILPSLRFARQQYPNVRAMHEIPFAAVREDLANGIHRTSFTHNLLGEIGQQEDQEYSAADKITANDIKGAAGAVFIAGQDTTWAAISVFILHMVLNVRVQEKAWAEIESVVGKDRLPTFEDRSNLPYVEHIVQESFRIFPGLPLGIPHKSSEDDIYNGMFIPKGNSLIIPNAYAMARDDQVYRNPAIFDPDRYTKKGDGAAGEPFPTSHFGFGRRQALSREHLGDASVWIAVATMLATLEFRKDIDKDGVEITPNPSITVGIVSHFEPFRCRIVPRSQDAKVLLATT